jgi:hypothetical protein
MTIYRPSTRPPRWAEALLRLLLKPEDRESVSGDLLEEYRQSILPERGKGADAWYLCQVAGFLWRSTWIWALVFSGAFLARTAYDWLVPTTDFHFRAEVSTYIGVATLLSIGLWAGWRSHSVVAGVLTTVIASQIAAAISAAGGGLLFMLLDTPELRREIAGSGGLGEVFVLPFMMALPAVILGLFGGVVGSLGSRLRSSFVR